MPCLSGIRPAAAKSRAMSGAMVAALVRADERLQASFSQITLPLLILHGTADRATVCQGSEYFHEHAGSTDKTLRLYEGHYHDLLADLGREEVLSDISQWIDARMVRQAQGSSAETSAAE